ncbi:MAG: sphinganine-1-phosphate aldolase, partial [Arenicella sp.]
MTPAIHKAMPQSGLDEDEILSQLDEFKSEDPDYKNGKVWSLVYYIDEAHQQLLKESYFKYSSENGLN